MPIQEIKQTSDGPSLLKICQPCKAVDTIDVNTLKLGNKQMPNVIDLPPCSKCKAVEMLVRTTDASVPDRMSGHRKVVNALANYLSGAGKVDVSALPPGTTLEPAAPVGALYGVVAPPKAAPAPVAGAPGSPLALAMDALKAAQVAVAAAQAAGATKK